MRTYFASGVRVCNPQRLLLQSQSLDESVALLAVKALRLTEPRPGWDAFSVLVVPQRVAVPLVRRAVPGMRPGELASATAVVADYCVRIAFT